MNAIVPFLLQRMFTQRSYRRRRYVSKAAKYSIRKKHTSYLRKKENRRLKNKPGTYLEGKISKILTLSGVKGVPTVDQQQNLDKILEVAVANVVGKRAGRASVHVGSGVSQFFGGSTGSMTTGTSAGGSVMGQTMLS